MLAEQTRMYNIFNLCSLPKYANFTTCYESEYNYNIQYYETSDEVMEHDEMMEYDRLLILMEMFVRKFFKYAVRIRRKFQKTKKKR